MAMTGPRTIVLLSHDHGYSAPWRRFLKASGHLVLVGFAGSFSLRRYELTDHANCEMVDIRHDPRTLALIRRSKGKKRRSPNAFHSC